MHKKKGLQIAVTARRSTHWKDYIVDSRLKRVFLEDDINNPQPIYSVVVSYVIVNNLKQSVLVQGHATMVSS